MYLNILYLKKSAETFKKKGYLYQINEILDEELQVTRLELQPETLKQTFKRELKAPKVKNVECDMYLHLWGFVCSEDICWSLVCGGILWMQGGTLFLLLRIRVSESFHEGTIQHLSEEATDMFRLLKADSAKLLKTKLTGTQKFV